MTATIHGPIGEGDRVTFADTSGETYTGIITDIRAGKTRGTTVITLAEASCAQLNAGGRVCEREAGHLGQHRSTMYGAVTLW